MIVSPLKLGRTLLHRPAAPSRLIKAVARHGVYVEFAKIARAVFPEEAGTILQVEPAHGEDREVAMLGAFCRLVDQRLFPIYECEEFEQVVHQVPFVRRGWLNDDYHEANRSPGEMLLWALSEDPWGDPGIRLPVLDACRGYVPDEVLARIPEGGVPRQQLHENLDRTRYEGTAVFCDWLWLDTGNIFLDTSDEMSVYDADWSPECVEALRVAAEEWVALEREMSDVIEWLEKDPARHFLQLLEAALTPRGQMRLPLYPEQEDEVEQQLAV